MSKIWGAVVGAMTSWHEAKLFIENSVSITHDALHVIFGVLAWLLFALMLRRPIGSWRPWLWLLALIAWTETVDLWMERWPDPRMQYAEGIKDLLLTMLVPTVLLLAARARPELFRQGSGRSKRR